MISLDTDYVALNAAIWRAVATMPARRHITRCATEELKLGTFQAADYGQTQLYLRWLDRYERQPGEESPIGLILCAGKSDERVELLELEKTGIRVAQYLTELPPQEILQRRLHETIVSARARLDHDSGVPDE